MKTNPFLRTSLALLGLIFLLAAYFNHPFYTLGPLVLLVWLSYKKRRPRPAPQEPPLLTDFFTKYGVPEEHIVVNPTRGNEIDGAILYYRRLGFLIINGHIIYKSDITGLALKNVENPYLPCDYQLRIATSRDDFPILYVSVGADINWAGEVTKQLQVALSER